MAYVVSHDFFPEGLAAGRHCKVSSPRQKLDYLLTWLQTTPANAIPRIFAPDPYSLPPPSLKDLSPVTAFNTARNAVEKVNALESSLKEQLHKISEQITTLSNRQSPPSHTPTPQQVSVSKCRPTTDATTNTKVSPSPPPGSAEFKPTAENVSNAWVSPSPPLVSTGQAPPSGTPSATPSPPPMMEGPDEASPPQSPPIIAERREEEDVERGWRNDGHSARDRKRINNSARKDMRGSPPYPTTRTPSHLQKRCHKVVHNLPDTVRLDDIKECIKHITGAEPLIAAQLPCKVRGRTAFRITCLYEHINKLTGDRFGDNVKVSHYNYLRDFPVGTLRDLPTSPPQTAEGSHGTPTTPRGGIHSPEIRSLLNNARHHS